MSEVSYAELDEFDEDIFRLAERARANEVRVILLKLINSQISRGEAISKIYLEDMEKPPEKKTYKKR
jgi:hypothetical protein